MPRASTLILLIVALSFANACQLRLSNAGYGQSLSQVLVPENFGSYVAGGFVTANGGGSSSLVFNALLDRPNYLIWSQRGSPQCMGPCENSSELAWPPALAYQTVQSKKYEPIYNVLTNYNPYGASIGLCSFGFPIFAHAQLPTSISQNSMTPKGCGNGASPMPSSLSLESGFLQAAIYSNFFTGSYWAVSLEAKPDRREYEGNIWTSGWQEMWQVAYLNGTFKMSRPGCAVVYSS